MASRNQKLGKAGEQAAAEFLERKGYTILKTNYRFGRAEIDLIAEKDCTLIFIEVKSRSQSFYGMPEEGISARKEMLYLEAADDFMQRYYPYHDLRFDVISVSFDHQHPHITHFEDLDLASEI